MNAAADLSILMLITKATLVVQLVMALLVAISLASWTAIFSKGLAIRRARAETAAFEQRFWSGAELGQLHQQATQARRKTGALERIFEGGMTEFLKLRGRGDAQATLDGARRAMRAAYQRELDALESRLSFLASAGSVSPYIGLFGTVWGIMNSFIGLSQVQQATLSTVATGFKKGNTWIVSASGGVQFQPWAFATNTTESADSAAARVAALDVRPADGWFWD